MPVISSPEQFNEDDLFVDLRSVVGAPLYLKCEGFNFAGSIKVKAATAMVEAAERDARLRPGDTIVESSSGNLGVALAMVAATRGYTFVCVTDSRCNLATRRTIEALGGRVVVVTVPQQDGGLLGARLEHVRQLCREDPSVVWLDQYRNQQNWRSHYERTGPAITRRFPTVDVVFVGAGTCGTLMGVARWLKEQRHPVRVVAVDAVGSVTFDSPPGRRVVPGLGAAVRPPMLDPAYVDDVVHVSEADTVRTCHRLAREGYLVGGSTGTVVSAAQRWLEAHDGPPPTAVAIAPDLGERYLDSIYQTHWVQELFGQDLLDEVVAGPV